MIILAAWADVMDTSHFSGWAVYALVALAVAAMFTAFYMFRLIFMTFFGEYRGNQADHMYAGMLAAEGFEGPDPHEHAHDDHGGGDHHGHDEHAHEPHESPPVMTVALCILAFLGVFGGHFWLADPGHLLHPTHAEPWFTELATPESMYGAEVGGWVESRISEGIVDHDSHLAHSAHTRAVVVSLLVASLGILGAWFLYVRRRDLPARIASSLGLLYHTVRSKYFVDEAIDRTVIRGTMGLAHVQKWFDQNVIDGTVNLVGRVNRFAGTLSAWFDRTFVDGLVNARGAGLTGLRCRVPPAADRPHPTVRRLRRGRRPPDRRLADPELTSCPIKSSPGSRSSRSRGWWRSCSPRSRTSPWSS